MLQAIKDAPASSNAAGSFIHSDFQPPARPLEKAEHDIPSQSHIRALYLYYRQTVEHPHRFCKNPSRSLDFLLMSCVPVYHSSSSGSFALSIIQPFLHNNLSHSSVSLPPSLEQSPQSFRLSALRKKRRRAALGTDDWSANITQLSSRIDERWNAGGSNMLRLACASRLAWVSPSLQHTHSSCLQISEYQNERGGRWVVEVEAYNCCVAL